MPVESPTVLVALATFVGALIGAIAQFSIHRLDVWRERESLRRALISELQSQGRLDDERLRYLSDTENPEALMANKIYAENTADIGLLTPDEAGNVVDYHTTLERFVELNEGMEDKPDDHEAWEMIAGMRETLEGYRRETIAELERNMGGPLERLL